GGQLWDGFRQGADRRRRQPAAGRGDLRDGERLGQADRAAHRTAVPRVGISSHGHGGHGAVSAGPRRAGRAGGQGPRRAAECDRSDRVGRGAAPDQYAPREVHAGGRLRDPARGADAPCAVHDHDVSRERRLRRNHCSAQPNRQREESPRMARKNDRRKPAAGSGKGSRPGVAKAPAKSAGKAGKAAVKPSAAAAPAAPKVKFRGRVLENEPLARHTTYRIGGPARYLVLPADSDDVITALDLAQDRGLPWVVLGLGSNVLVKDGGFPGAVIRIGKGLDRFEMKGATAIVGAGLPTPLLARRTAEAGFAGVERFIGIPGTVGGGVYMNAGAHGAEFAEIVTEVSVMDAAGKLKQLTRKQVPFKYRSSGLGQAVALETKLSLGEENPAKLKEVQGRLLRWRKAGTPFDQPCCGSVFKNPSGTRTAGMLIEEAGLKGFRIGGAHVSLLSANYIVNTGNATAGDVLKVIDHVRKTVAKKLSVELELEVKVIGV